MTIEGKRKAGPDRTQSEAVRKRQLAAVKLRRQAMELEQRAASTFRTIATLQFEAQRELAEAAMLKAQARQIEEGQ